MSNGNPRASMKRRQAWILRLAASVAVVAASLTAVEAQQRHLACGRGNLEVCQSLADQARIAPGVRAAAQQLLIEVQDGIAECDRGQTSSCAELLDRYPDLPAPVRESLSAEIARAKAK